MASPEHTPQGDPCERCGMDVYRHRQRTRNRQKYTRQYEKTRKRGARPQRQDRIIGIDGEGQGRGPHIYNFLACVDESGEEWTVANKKGLSTKQVLDTLLSLPDRSLVVGYALGYDNTKWLADLPNKSLYNLFHEETRQFVRNNRVLYHPVRWKGYRLNYCNRRLSISRNRRTVAIWDIFAFFQAKFTKAISDWKIASSEVVDWIERMKQQRSHLDRLDFSEVEKYCKLECLNLAKLARALIDAHKKAGLPLKSFYGAGSTASVFLKNLKIKRKRGTYPEAMKHAIACAFFGGRFENSFIGPIHDKVYSYDISSAYPYQATFLPCLQHGKWKLVHQPTYRQISLSTLALCHWTIPKTEQRKPAWGVLPVRSKIGTIAFPSSARAGWCWKDEFQVSRKIARVVCTEAWLYHTKCDCAPFASIPKYYLERLRIGKEGPGIVLKLGMNSIYGKLAQSKGVNPPFQSWIWAGNITSGTRAQLLESLLIANDPWDILMFATDSVWSRVPLKMPKPRNTGTDVKVKCVDGTTVRKPLGGWEEKVYKKGVFCVRPGIYFPFEEPGEDKEKLIEKFRARGLGRKTVYEKWPQIIKAWKQGKEGIAIGGTKKDGEPYLARFIGVKSSISRVGHSGQFTYRRSERYGEWVPHEIKVSFSPWPKRERVLKNGRLEVWRHFDFDSFPYSNAMENPEADMLEQDTDTMLEQPDGADFSEYVA
jgi:DNA polymerase type B, organellar and viral